jgi:hypothetical protein
VVCFIQPGAAKFEAALAVRLARLLQFLLMPAKATTHQTSFIGMNAGEKLNPCRYMLGFSRVVDQVFITRCPCTGKLQSMSADVGAAIKQAFIGQNVGQDTVVTWDSNENQYSCHWWMTEESYASSSQLTNAPGRNT